MAKRIKLDKAYIERVRKRNRYSQKQVEGLSKKKIPCKFCSLPTIQKYADLQGHFEARCKRCGQISIYNAADYRRYSYIPLKAAN
jgi:hypothetical protein